MLTRIFVSLYSINTPKKYKKYMIPIPEEMKVCNFCNYFRTCEENGTHCLNEGTYEFEGFEIHTRISDYAKANFELGIKYANEAQIKEEEK